MVTAVRGDGIEFEATNEMVGTVTSLLIYRAVRFASLFCFFREERR